MIGNRLVSLSHISNSIELFSMNEETSLFLKYLRGFSILTIILMHCGLSYCYEPYSQFLQVVIPIFFFASGAVSVLSFKKSNSLLSYYKKRLLGIFMPYYFFLVLVFLLYVYIYKSLPDLTLWNIYCYLTILPNAIIPPAKILSHLWFLHDLWFVILLSPFLICTAIIRGYLDWIVALLLLLFSVPFIINCSYDFFVILGHDLLSPLLYSLFFLYGILFVLHKLSTKILFSVVIFSIFICFLCYSLFSFELSLLHHKHPPDIFFNSFGLGLISIVLLLKSKILSFIKNNSFFHLALIFLWKHTFAIYLLHIPVLIFYYYNILPFLHLDTEDIVVYGLVRIFFVVFVTCLLSPVFSYMTRNINNLMWRTLRVPNK